VDILPSAGPFTLSAWIKPGANNGTTQYPLSLGGTAPNRRFHAAGFNTGIGASFSTAISPDGTATSSATVPVTVTPGQWYLYVLRRSATNVWQAAVWNGSAWFTSSTTPTVILNPTAEPFAVGALASGGSPANASVDSIKLWAEYVPLDGVLREQWP
jgi:hypothetical protein